VYPALVHHEFEWDGTPFEIDLGTKPVSFIGAWVCSNCGMRAPCGSQALKEFFFNRIAGNPDKDDDCANILVEKIMYS